MDVASPRKSPLLFQHCYCNSSTVKLFLSCLSHIISSCAHTFKWKMLRTIRQAKNKRAVSPRRKTACSRCSWFTLISPLGPFNTSHTPEGRIRATDEAWTMKHFSALFPTSLDSRRTPTPHEISGNVEGVVRMTSLARTDSIDMGFWGERNGTQSSPVCWGQYQRVSLSAGGMWNWNNSSWEGRKPHHLHEIYGVGPATELTGFDLGELLNHVWLKNSLQRIISAFWVNEKPARTIYGSKRPGIRGREKKVIKKIPRSL